MSDMNIEIYGRVTPICSWCEAAKALLERHDQPYVFKDIVADPTLKEELFARAPSVRSVPQIFVDGKHIGGYSDFEKYYSTI